VSLASVASALDRYLAGEPVDPLVAALGTVVGSALADGPAGDSLRRLALADVERVGAERVQLTCAAAVSRPDRPDQVRPCRIDLDRRHRAVTVRLGCGGSGTLLRLRLP
jgi:hypothetical protein